MHSASSSVASRGISSWFSRGEAWLDSRGRPAWIVATIFSFIVFWPVGLAFLAYMIWSKRMFSRSNCGQRRGRHSDRMGYSRVASSSGNAAFDSYKADMLRRLESEQTAFETFLQRLREAKDKSEFDAFMDDRAKAGTPTDGEAPKAGDY